LAFIISFNLAALLMRTFNNANKYKRSTNTQANIQFATAAINFITLCGSCLLIAVSRLVI